MKLVQLPAQGHKHQKEHQLPVIHSSGFILASLFDLFRRTGISLHRVSKCIAYCVRARFETSSKELLLIRAQTLSVATLNKVFIPSISYVPQLHPYQQPALRHPLAIQNWCSVGYLSCSHCVHGVAGDLPWGRQELRGDCHLKLLCNNCFSLRWALPNQLPLSHWVSGGLWLRWKLCDAKKCFSASSLLLSCEVAECRCIQVCSTHQMSSASACIHWPHELHISKNCSHWSIICVSFMYFRIFR